MGKHLKKFKPAKIVLNITKMTMGDEEMMLFEVFCIMLMPFVQGHLRSCCG